MKIIFKVQNQVALTCQVTSGPIVSIAENSEKVPWRPLQSQQIPYEVVPTIEPLHNARDIMIDSQEIGLHAWLLGNVLPDLAHIVSENRHHKSGFNSVKN